MTLYFYTSGDEVAGLDPIPLPQNWANVSSLDALSPEELAAFGWKPVVDELPEFDGATEVCRRTGWEVGETQVTSLYEVVPKDIGRIRDEARARVAQKRWEVETGGLEVGGMVVDTSRESQALLAGANLLATAFPDQELDWKGRNGWVRLPAAQVLAISAAVGLHVQACFTHERMLGELIDAADTPAAVRNAEVW